MRKRATHSRRLDLPEREDGSAHTSHPRASSLYGRCCVVRCTLMNTPAEMARERQLSSTLEKERLRATDSTGSAPFTSVVLGWGLLCE